MTTKVTVDAHAGWPVKVQAIDTDQNGDDTDPIDLGTVEPNQEQEFYCHSHRKLLVTEMPTEG